MDGFKVVEEMFINDEDILNIFPIEKIEKVVGRNVKLSILRDDEILDKYIQKYNMPVWVRAHNDSISKFGKKASQKYLEELYRLRDLADFRTYAGISLPQILVEDNLGFSFHVISIHFAKLREDEIFLNDVIFYKNEDEKLKGGVAEETIKNFINLCKKNNVAIISGHVANKDILPFFKRIGFVDDKREKFGNDRLYEISIQFGYQCPVYIEL